jgi:hypothetical protein
MVTCVFAAQELGRGLGLGLHTPQSRPRPWLFLGAIRDCSRGPIRKGLTLREQPLSLAALMPARSKTEYAAAGGRPAELGPSAWQRRRSKLTIERSFQGRPSSSINRSLSGSTSFAAAQPVTARSATSVPPVTEGSQVRRAD